MSAAFLAAFASLGAAATLFVLFAIGPDRAAAARRAGGGVSTVAGLLAFALVFAAAGEQAWELPVAFERVAPLPLLGGVGLLAAGLAELGRASLFQGDLREGGVYARCRHPQYAGVILAALGVAFVGRSGLAVLLSAALALLLFGRARSEEIAMARRDRVKFPAYRRRVPALGIGSPARPSHLKAR